MTEKRERRTPRTDKFVRFRDFDIPATEALEFARTLEREVAELERERDLMFADKVAAEQRAEASEAKLREGVVVPDEVRLAFRVLLNHVEPGWNNCKVVASGWLESLSAAEREA